VGAILAWENAAAGAAAEISTTSEAAGLGIRSVVTPQIADVWRSGLWTGGNTISITVNLGVVRSDLRLFLLAWPRDGVQPSAAARVRLAAASSAGVEVFNSGLLPLVTAGTGLWVFLAPAAITAQFVTFTFTSGAADRYLQIGRVWVGPALVSSRAVSYGQSRGYIDAGSNERAGVSDIRYAMRGAVRRRVQWSFPGLPEADALALDSLALMAGTTGQVFGSPFEAMPARDGVLGHFTETPAPKLATFRRWSSDISIEEDL
jgi:hypothetical protein